MLDTSVLRHPNNSVPSLDPYLDWYEVFLLEVTRHGRHTFGAGLPGVNGKAFGWHVEGQRRDESARIALRGRLQPPCACNEPSFARGLCRPHYYQEYNKTRVRGPLKPRRTKQSTRQCSHNACDKFAWHKGLCPKHYHRQRKEDARRRAA